MVRKKWAEDCLDKWEQAEFLHEAIRQRNEWKSLYERSEADVKGLRLHISSVETELSSTQHELAKTKKDLTRWEDLSNEKWSNWQVYLSWGLVAVLSLGIGSVVGGIAF